MKEKVITQDQHVDAQLKRMQDLSKSDKNSKPNAVSQSYVLVSVLL